MTAEAKSQLNQALIEPLLGQSKLGIWKTASK